MSILTFYERRLLRQIRDPYFSTLHRIILILGFAFLISAVLSLMLWIMHSAGIPTIVIARTSSLQLFMFGALALGAAASTFVAYAAMSLARKIDSGQKIED